MKDKRISISKLMKELGKMVGSGDAYELWDNLSGDWVHTKGVIDRIVNQINRTPRAPSWALIIPMNYAKGDLDAIKELGKRISQFRNLLKVTIENYKQEFRFEEA